MSGHTPGPWVVDSTKVCMRLIRSRSHHAGQIATVYENYDANARLIAAAPDLLEALAGMLSIHDSVTMGQEQERREEWIPKARAAYAKATGAQP